MGTKLDLRSHAGFNYSGGDLVATSTAAAGAYADRSISGLTYFEGVLTTLTGVPAIGIVSTNWTIGNNLGTTTDSIGYVPTTGVVRSNSVTLSTIQTSAAGDRVCFAVDPLNRLLWIRTNAGNWNNSGLANPATGVGGIDYSGISLLGTLRPAISASLTGTVWTMTFSTPFTGVAPAGFVSIDTIAYILAQFTNDPRENAFYQYTPATFGYRETQLPQTSTGKWYNGLTITLVSGTVMELGVVQFNKRVDVYDRNTGELLGTAFSAVDGTWQIPCLGRPSVRVVADDPTTFNSLVYDNVTPV